jgi:bacterial/archaeal transporter family-2 protein
MNSASVVLMLIAGAGIAAQIAINAHLRTVTGSALWAANITFAVSLLAGLAALAAAMAFSPVALPNPALWRAPVWVWMGGLGGAVYVLLAILLAGRLGALLLSAAGIVGQLGASLLIDHYGWFGMPVQRATPARLIGVALLAAGVVLIRWK